jgi:outer membrane protein OmpA-like peptidoglycan-associated protein
VPVRAERSCGSRSRRHRDHDVAPAGLSDLRGPFAGNAALARALSRTTLPARSLPSAAIVRTALIQRDDEAPIDRESEFTPVLELNPRILRLGFEATRGRHLFGGSAGLENPLTVPFEILGRPIAPLDPSLLTAQIFYQGRCNQAFRSALVEFDSRPLVSGPVSWRIGASFDLRIGRLLVGPGASLDFSGSDLNTVIFFIRTLNTVSDEIPPECRAPPPERREPEPPRTGEGDGGDGGGGRPPPRRPRPPTPTPTRLPSFTLGFHYDSTILRGEETIKTVGWIRSLMQLIPQLRVELRGHASLEGGERYNLRLSRRRADAVKRLLTAGGVSDARIDTLALGEYAPAAAERPSAGRSDLVPGSRLEQTRSLNRRVEAVLYDPTGAYEPRFPAYSLSSHDLSLGLGPTVDEPRLQLGDPLPPLRY